MTKLLIWLKKPENIVMIVLLIAVTIIGIIDDNLEIIIKVYLGMALIGLLIGLCFYLKEKLFK